MRRLGTLGVVSLAILSLLLEGTAKSAAGAEAIYFTTSNFPASIQRVNKDGSGLQTLLTGVNAQSNLAIDVNAGKIYYSQSGMDISKANIDGTEIEVVLDENTQRQGPISDIELDTDSKKLYLIAGSNETIVRMNLDSSNFEFLLSDSNSRFIALTLDLISEKIYFTDTLGNRIGRVNLDGSNIETLIQFDVNVDLNDIKLDVAGGKMYWTDQLTNKIQRANLDGTGIEDLVNDSGRSLALDLAAGKMYWPSPVFGGIRRANLDGSDVELVLASSADPFGLAFGPAFVPFAVFTATQVELALGPRANDDAFTIEATFSLGAASNGINPVTEPVTLRVGTFSTTLPAGSFQQDKKGRFAFKGTIDEVSLDIELTPLDSTSLAFSAKGKNADLTGTVNPVTIILTIGDDTGSITVTARFK